MSMAYDERRTQSAAVNRPSLNLGDLAEHWTVVGAEQDPIAAKRRDTQLAFALLLKFYGRFGRSPSREGGHLSSGLLIKAAVAHNCVNSHNAPRSTIWRPVTRSLPRPP